MHRPASLRTIIASVAFCTSPALAILPYQVVTYDGQPAPNIPGGGTVSFAGGFPIASINADGRVAFAASVASNPTDNSAVWTWDNGSTSLVARSSTPAPGGGTIGPIFTHAVINAPGQVAFFGQASPATSSTTLFVSTPQPGGTYSHVAAVRPGQTLPGFSSPVTGAGSFLLADNGHIFAEAAVQPTTPGGNDNRAWLMGNPGSLSLLARAYHPHPLGFTPETVDGLAINSAGQLLFNSHTTSGSTAGPFLGNTAAATRVPMVGSPAPGTAQTFPATARARYMISSGIVAVQSTTIPHGLWIGTPDSLSLLALRGNPAPGTATTFQNLTTVVPNNAGAAAFFTTLASGDNGIFAGSPGGTLQKVALRGEPAPGTAGTFFSVSPFELAFNDLGQVAFTGGLTAVVDPINGSQGIWAGTPGNLQLVAQAGDTINLDGSSRTIGTLFLQGNAQLDQPSGAGANTSLANDGTLLYTAKFTDGTYAVLTTSIPEPTSLLAALGLLPSLSPLRRRRSR